MEQVWRATFAGRGFVVGWGGWGGAWAGGLRNTPHTARF